MGCGYTVIFKCCQRRLRILKLDTAAGVSYAGGVNRLNENWSYYAKHSEGANSDELQVELFLDAGVCEYPAVVEEAAEQSNEELSGLLEVDKTSPLSWIVTILVLVSLILCGVAAFVAMIVLGVRTFEDNIAGYEKGVSELVDWLKKNSGEWISQDALNKIEENLQSWLQNSVSTYLTSLLSNISSGFFQFLLFVIYLLFWLSEPLPVSTSVVDVFKAYLFLKTLICILFAILMSGLLWCLNCGLWPLFFIITFVLNYIPEIGALIVGFLSLPAVLFDGSVEPFERRLQNTLLLVIVGLTFKIVTANIIEVTVYTTRGGEFMRMHSVVMMVTIMVFGQVLGITGLFLSVPMAAAIKYCLLSSEMPAMILHPLIALIEGDDTAPHRGFVNKVRAAQQSQGAAGDGVELAASTAGGNAAVGASSAATQPMRRRLLEMEAQVAGSSVA